MATAKNGYYNSAGQRLPSVTTILSRFKESGALLKWAYRQGREHGALEARGLDAPRDLYDVTKKAADAGTIAHDLIERFILGIDNRDESLVTKLPSSADGAEPDVVQRALNSFSQFKRWFANTRIEIIATEMPQVSERYGFAGTLDAVGRDSDGRIVLVDWKTSNGVYSDYLYQLAAYGLLLRECKPEWTVTGGFHLLRVAKESADFAHHYWGELDDAAEGFLHMVELYKLDQRVRKRA